MRLSVLMRGKTDVLMYWHGSGANYSSRRLEQLVC